MIETQDSLQMADQLQQYALSLGAELYGVASARAYAEQFPDKPSPARFIEDARSIIVIGIPFEPSTVATVLRPELAGLRQRAADQVGTRASLVKMIPWTGCRATCNRWKPFGERGAGYARPSEQTTSGRGGWGASAPSLYDAIPLRRWSASWTG